MVCIYESGARSRFMDRAPLSYLCSAISLRDSKAVSVALGRSKSGFAAVFRHHLRLQLLRAWRRPCNGVRSCFDGGENAFFGTAS